MGCVDPEEMAQLKKRISTLERKMAKLEKTQSQANNKPEIDYPKWVLKGSLIEGEHLFGVGSAKGIRNVSLARMTADNRARAEIAKLMSPGAKVEMKMSGVEIIDHWIHPENGALYALARLKKQ